MQTSGTSARQAVREAAVELERAGVPEPAAAAEVLLAELIGAGRAEILLGHHLLSEEQTSVYESWVRRRRAREPVQRILGYEYFRHLKLELTDGTLIPRPETESVVDAALERIDRRPGPCRVLDVGTGSGAIAVSIAQERPRCDVHATDIAEAATRIARRNARAAGTKVHFYHGDLVSGLESLHGKISLLVSNPPYVRSGDLRHLAPEVCDWDPPEALDGGEDGLFFYRRIFDEVEPLLETSADVVLETGDGQAEEVLEIGRESGFRPLGIRPDLTGKPRMVLLQWNG
ncbi:MAG: peptide chain release factor N(5)-glutamine methyltransferase [Rubrobacteraceae bacterium]